MQAMTDTLFDEPWAERVRRLALAVRAVSGDPLTRTPKQRMEYRAAVAELEAAIEEVE